MQQPASNSDAAVLQTQVTHDSVQQFLQRKAEMEKNKQQFLLTEADAALILTHSTDVVVKDGDIIYKEGQPFSSVYRVKSGLVDFSMRGIVFHTATKGWFIGDTLLVHNKPRKIAHATMTARGPVLLAELNIDFARNLLTADVALSLKFMRHVAIKLASMFLMILGNLKHPSLYPLSPSDAQPTADAQSIPFINNRVKQPKKHHHHPHIHHGGAAYKVYNLHSTSAHTHGNHTLVIKPRKYKLVTKAFGMHSKTRIYHTRLENVTRLGDQGATFMYRPKKIITAFFNSTTEREEFIAISASILSAGSNSPTINRNTALDTEGSECSEDSSEVDDSYQMTEEDKALYKDINQEHQFKKGDVLFEEGDLFQRVYTVVRGLVIIRQGGIVVNQIQESEIFGISSLLVLRPSSCTAEIASETATILVMPWYKMKQLMETHVGVANRIFTNAAQIMESQTVRVLAQIEEAWQPQQNTTQLSSEVVTEDLYTEG